MHMYVRDFSVSVPFNKFNVQHDNGAKKDQGLLIRWFETEPSLLMAFQTGAPGGIDEETGEVRRGDTVCTAVYGGAKQQENGA